jgi:hypothetical protein
MWRASLDPPWPAEARWVAVLMCAVTAVIAYVLAQNGVSRRDGSKTAQQKLRRKHALLASGTLLLGMFAALAYIYEYESSVLEELQPSAQGSRQIRVVKGAERMPELKADPHSDLEVLQDHLYRPEEVWTSSSLLRLRMYLLGLYLAAFCLLTLGLSFAVLSMTPEQTARN